MKYFILRLQIRDGEREYYSRSTLTAESFEDADNQADERAKTFWGDGFKEDEKDRGYYQLFGETYVEVDGLDEVSKEDFDVLKKYI